MDPFRIVGPTLLNVSGGRTSGYMLRRYLDANGGALPDDVHAVFANTALERLETLDFVRDMAERWGVAIRWIERDGKAPPGGRFREVTYGTASRHGEPFAELITEKQFLPNAVMRHCSQNLKLIAARDFMRAQGYEHWTSALGLRRDEPHRVAKIRARDEDEWDVACPLYDAHITKADVTAFWSAQPFDLDLRWWESNCAGCFMKSAAILERTERDRPGSLAWWSERERERGASFDKRRTYLRLIERAQRQPLMGVFDDPADEDPALPCACTD